MSFIRKRAAEKFGELDGRQLLLRVVAHYKVTHAAYTWMQEAAAIMNASYYYAQLYIVSHQAFIIDPLVIIQPSRTYTKSSGAAATAAAVVFTVFTCVNTGVMNTHNGLHFVQQLRLFFLFLFLSHSWLEYADL